MDLAGCRLGVHDMYRNMSAARLTVGVAAKQWEKALVDDDRR
jgi:hypothetical protein